MEKEKKRREPGLDIIRCIAFFCVISVHFFNNIGFDRVGIEEWPVFWAICAKLLFTICVPLFLLLSGYLLRKKTFSLRYYQKLGRVLALYFLCSILCYIDYVRSGNGKIAYSLGGFMELTLGYQAAPYGWYIEMYIGLYLLAPALNTLCEAMKEKSLWLIGTLLAVCAGPSVLNLKIKILPEYFIALYPVMYYVIGWFIGEKRPRVNKKWLIALMPLTNLLGGAVLYGISTPYTMLSVYLKTSSGAPVVVLAVSVFLLLYDVRFEKLPQWAYSAIVWISRLTLPAYLLSSIVDHWAYAPLMKSTEYIRQRIRLKYFMMIVPKVIVMSLLMAAVVDGLYNLGVLAYTKITRKNAADGAKRTE